MSRLPVDCIAVLAFLSIGGCGEVRQEPSADDSLLAVGRAYLDQGQYDQAVAVYQEAVSRDSLSRDAHFYLGLAHLQRKSMAAAAHFARAIALDSTYIPSYHNLAIAHL
ncbi:MAG: tetratricopeptide repeat protein, partial [Gemmatimonadota bacterium]|nr:tetratricopeptide repeat protein [Gemmatimonadota bacterium]